MSDRRFDPKKMAKLDSPERRKQLPQEEILALLQVEENDDILDLGAGTGYFTFPVAEQTTGTVYALDIETQMLDYIGDQIKEKEVKNIECIQGPIEEIPLESKKVERVIASMVLHEVEPLSKGLEELHRVLKPGGRCICVEWEKVESEQGPPQSHRIHSDVMMEAIKQAGFKNVERTSPSEAVYVLAFDRAD